MPGRAHPNALTLPLAVILASAGILSPQQKPAEGERSEPVWIVLAPAKTESAGGARLANLGEGVITVEGPVPASDTFTLEFVTDLREITGFRLEALPKESGSGPGLFRSGNFVLSTFRVTSASRLTPQKQNPVALATARASWSQAGWDVRGAIDSNPASGWGIAPRFGQTHVAVFETAKNIDHEAGAILRVTMEFLFGDHHILGRFRLAATTAPRPLPSPRAENDEAWARTQVRINTAIDRGVLWLLRHQRLDGSWRDHSETYPSGQTALSLYTLLKCGVGPDHGAVRRALEFLRAHPDRRTYSTACAILALCALDAKAHRSMIQGLTRDLISWQRIGFGYPDGAVDLSNTQYAALALRAAAQNGVSIPAGIWTDLATVALKHQEKTTGAYAPAGFSYHPGGPPSLSMTAAGVGILAIVEEQSRAARGDVAAARKSGIAWLAKWFSPSSNMIPGHKADETRTIYWLYGCERVGALCALDQLGDHDWYREGGRWLADVQEGDGGWGGDRQSNTCFALLFLNKATAATTGRHSAAGSTWGQDDPGRDVSLRASGDTPLAVWISRLGDGACRACAWPGEEDKGLRVLKVEYSATRSEMTGAWTPLGTIDGDAQRPSGSEPFALRHSFAWPGKWWIRAQVHVLLPRGQSGEPGQMSILESAPLAVEVWSPASSDLLAWAGDAARNLLVTSGAAAAEASSDWKDGAWAPKLALDGLQGRGWLCRDDDLAPEIRISLGRSVRADTLLLSHTTLPWDPAFTARARKVALTLNGEGLPLVFEMIPDDLRKTIVPLSKPMMVRSVALKILERDQGPGQHSALGFAEVELQLRSTEKK